MISLRKNAFLKTMCVAFVMLIVTGCATVGTDYSSPGMSSPDQWHTPLKGGLMTETPVSPGLTKNNGNNPPIPPLEKGGKGGFKWWNILNDTELSSLIERAVAGNLDLKTARARVREARARRGVARGGFFPTLDAAGSATWNHSSNDGDTGKTSELYMAGFDAAWELDIFGGVRHSVEASQADMEASEEELRDVFVSLLAEVALNYIEVRTFQSRLSVAEANLALQKETYQLTDWRHQAGLTDELAVQQARYSLESTRSQIPSLRTGLEEAMNRIAVLMGDQPGVAHSELENPADIPSVPLKVAVGVPADVLRQRADVRQAERQLAAQSARVGVATAELYPRFVLSGSIGLEALSPGKLLSSAVRTLSGGALLSWPVFRGGTIRQNIEIQSALQEQYLIRYEATILSALEEVENVLVAYAAEQDRRDSLREAEQAAQKAAELARHKYEGGLTDFDNVLEAQRSLLNIQDQLAQSNGTVTSNLVRLYKALGGGWISMASYEPS